MHHIIVKIGSGCSHSEGVLSLSTDGQSRSVEGATAVANIKGSQKKDINSTRGVPESLGADDGTMTEDRCAACTATVARRADVATRRDGKKWTGWLL
jgi:hypothetical protein